MIRNWLRFVGCLFTGRLSQLRSNQQGDTFKDEPVSVTEPEPEGYPIPGTKEPIHPINKVPRYSCPFYGFHCYVESGILVDQQGNQCGLKVSSQFPCHMQRADWAKCSMNDAQGDKILKLFRHNFTIHPREFEPEDQNAWQGISFSDWQDYVFDPRTPRPERNTSPQ